MSSELALDLSPASSLRPYHSRLHVHNVPTPFTNQVNEIMAGLSESQKHISPKYFYDEQGSRLFDEITRLKAYYPARTENLILGRYAAEMVHQVGRETVIIEPGSGTCDKVRHLLDASPALTYAPIEISRECLLRASEELTAQYPELAVHAICGDFTRISELPDVLVDTDKIAFFPGSTIGNFEAAEAVKLLKNIHSMIGLGNRLLIGVDLIKPVHLLHAAYNDPQGVTAQFNLNVMRHIGRILDCHFDLTKFYHQAHFNPAHSRIEMHLTCQASHEVLIGNKTLRFEKGETIHTENSYKYTVEQFEVLAYQAGFKRVSTWMDDDQLFSFHALEAI